MSLIRRLAAQSKLAGSKRRVRGLRLENLDPRCLLAGISPGSDTIIVAEPPADDLAVFVGPLAPVAKDITAEGTTAQFGTPRIVVHVAGPFAGNVEIDESLLPALPQGDEGSVLPDNFCGLRIFHAASFQWQDDENNLVEAENHSFDLQEEYEELYLGGVEFVGPLTKFVNGEHVSTCGEQESWVFGSLSYGGSGPQFGAVKLIIECFDEIEFIDHAYEPVEPHDFFDEPVEIPGFDEWCEDNPEFCEPDEDPTEDPEEDPQDPEGEPAFPGPDGLMADPDPIIDPPLINDLAGEPTPLEPGRAPHTLATDRLFAEILEEPAAAIRSPATHEKSNGDQFVERHGLVAELDEVAGRNEGLKDPVGQLAASRQKAIGTDGSNSGDPLSPWEKFCLETAGPADLGSCLGGDARSDAGHNEVANLGREALREGSGHQGPGGVKSAGTDRPEFPPSSISLRDGVLRIQGTQDDDTIVVYTNGVSVMTGAHEFPVDEVQSILIFGLAGNDVILNGTSIPDLIFGGLGNDVILAGDGVSYVYGQGDHDLVIGYDGNDFLSGGEGDDTLIGGAGGDTVSGDGGDDFLSGGTATSLILLWGEDVWSDPQDGSPDVLIGGADSDRFLLPAAAGEPVDTVSDFDEDEGDEELYTTGSFFVSSSPCPC